MGARGIKRANPTGRRTWVEFSSNNLIKIEHLLAAEKERSGRFVSRSEIINLIVWEYFASTEIDFKV